MLAWKKFLTAAFLLGWALWLYWPSFQYAIFFDDRNLLADGHVFNFFLSGFSFSPRWLPYITVAWIELLFENSLFVQRLFNFALHVITAYVLYRLVLQVSDHVIPHRNNTRAAVLAGALFLLHPVAVYAVGYIIQRSVVMATLFGLLSISAYFEGLTKRSQAQFWFAGLFYLLSAFSKEHAVLIPAAALLLTPFAGPIDRAVLRRILLPGILYTAVAAVVIYRYRFVIATVYEPYAQPMLTENICDGAHLCLWGLSALTQATLYFEYLWRMVLPVPTAMSIDWRVEIAQDYLQKKFWLGALALVTYTLIAGFWLLRRGRWGLVGYALLSPLALFAVELSTVRVQEPFVLYRAYLWIPLLFVLFPIVVNFISERLFWPVFIGLVLAFSWATHDRLHSFSTELNLWDDAARKLGNSYPTGAARIYVNRGALLVLDGQYEAALKDFSRVLRMEPGMGPAYRGQVFAYLGLKNTQSALDAAQSLVRVSLGDPDAYTARGYVYSAMGDIERARTDFQRGCKNYPRKQICVDTLLTVSRRGVAVPDSR